MSSLLSSADTRAIKRNILVLSYMCANQEQNCISKSEIARDHLLSILSSIKACRVLTSDIWKNLGLSWVCFCGVVGGEEIGGLQMFHKLRGLSGTNDKVSNRNGILWKMCPPEKYGDVPWMSLRHLRFFRLVLIVLVMILSNLWHGLEMEKLGIQASLQSQVHLGYQEHLVDFFVMLRDLDERWWKSLGQRRPPDTWEKGGHVRERLLRLKCRPRRTLQRQN